MELLRLDDGTSLRYRGGLADPLCATVEAGGAGLHGTTFVYRAP